MSDRKRPLGSTRQWLTLTAVAIGMVAVAGACGSGGTTDRAAVQVSVPSAPAGGSTETDPGGTPAVQKCQAAVHAATAAPPLSANVDPVVLIRTSSLAPLPVDLEVATKTTGLSRYDTVDQYLHWTPVPGEATWRSAMNENGFVVAEAAGYSAGSDSFGAESLNFASPAQALDFQRRTLDASCALGIVRDGRPIDGVPNSFAFIRTDGYGSFRASLVLGVSVVHLNICECAETLDPLGAAAQWGQAVARQVSGPAR